MITVLEGPRWADRGIGPRVELAGGRPSLQESKRGHPLPSSRPRPDGARAPIPAPHGPKGAGRSAKRGPREYLIGDVIAHEAQIGVIRSRSAKRSLLLTRSAVGGSGDPAP